MTHRPDHADRVPPRDPLDHADRVTAEIVRAIAAPPEAPDLTGPIMGRLGYMRAAPTVVRRRRRRRAVMRGATCLVAGAVVGAALYVHEAGPNARRPDGPSIPAAIGHEVRQHQRGFNGMLRTIRDLAPVRSSPGAAPGAAPGASPGASPEPGGGEDAWPSDWRLDEDIDRSAVGPVRWL